MKTGNSQRVGGEWVTFPGGELEGKRPRTLCPQCREGIRPAAAGDARPRFPRALCFGCYRADIERERALKAAGQLDTASVERFQSALPFEPVNRPRLQMLKVERSAARVAQQGAGRFVDKLRQAQLAARHALQQVAAGLSTGQSTAGGVVAAHDARAREMAAAIHAAELQLPESWIPFVVSR